MLVQFFGLSATAAYQRTSALKLIQAVPEAQVALFNGETTLSTMAATQGFIRKVEAEEKQSLSPTKKSEIFAAVVGKTGKQAGLGRFEARSNAVGRVQQAEDGADNNRRSDDAWRTASSRRSRGSLSHSWPWRAFGRRS
jgi:hypothetical protein